MIAGRIDSRTGVYASCLQSTYSLGYGTVVDSGTTFTYLPTAAFQRFSKAVDAYAKSKGLKRTGGGDPQVGLRTA